MTLPTTSISFSDINVELGRSSTAALSLGDAAVRSLSGQTSGAIDMGSLRGKSAISFTQTNQRGTSTSTVTLNASQSVTWTWSCVDRSGTGTYVPAAESGSQTSTTFSCGITARQTGATVSNISQTVDVTATFPGGSRSWEFLFGLGTQ